VSLSYNTVFKRGYPLGSFRLTDVEKIWKFRSQFLGGQSAVRFKENETLQIDKVETTIKIYFEKCFFTSQIVSGN
jgi:hypothetical protein